MDRIELRARTLDELILLFPLPPCSFALIGFPSCQDIVYIRRLVKQESNVIQSGVIRTQ